MNQEMNLKLIKKIHNDAGAKSNIAITRDWMDELPELKYMDQHFFDRMYDIETFLQEVKLLVNNEVEDSYFSINSFRRSEKQSSRVWHLNAFVLDFDYYKIKKYKGLSATEMYEIHIRDKLPLDPTALIDSGRGLYVIYSFKHACKAMVSTYKSIYKTFCKKFKEYGMDPNAMNVTQIIRIPGTLNSKSLRYVEVLEYHDTNYELKDFFHLFTFSREEVNDYKLNQKKKDDKPLELDADRLQKRFQFREEQTAQIILDLKKLIQLRNETAHYDGYRELLIYIVRKRMRWKGSSLQDELLMAHEMNDYFKVPLSVVEIEQNCTPYGITRCCSIHKIIEKLQITQEEQASMKIIKSKTLKDGARNKKKRIIKLLNLTAKQKEVLERRTKVAKLKNDGKRNAKIAMILTINKSTVTRDLQYIQTHGHKFIKRLKDAINELKINLNDISLIRTIKYDEQESLREWLILADVLLE